MVFRMSEDAVVSMLSNVGGSGGEPGLQDIGGTNADTGWVSMENFERIFAYVELGSWNANDDLDECRIQQAQDSSGTGAKDLTTDASGGNYDTDAPIDADGNFVVLEAKADDLDRTNGFTHVRLYVAEGGNTGTDNIGGFLLRYGAKFKRAEQQGAASAGAQVYVDPST